MRRINKCFLCHLLFSFCLFSVSFLTAQSVHAVTLNSDVVQKDYYHQATFVSANTDGNCSTLASSHVLQNQNTDIACNIYSLTFSVIDMNNYEAGDYLVIPLYVQNMTNNNTLDAFGRFNTFSIASTNGARADLVDIDFNNLSTGGGFINFYFRIWQGGNIYSATIGYGDGSSSIRLFPSESIAAGIVTLWHERADVSYSVSINAIGSDLTALYNMTDSRLSTLATAAWSIDSTVTSIDRKLGSIQSDVSSIRSSIAGNTQAIDNNTQAIDNQTQSIEDYHAYEEDTVNTGIDTLDNIFDTSNFGLTIRNPLADLLVIPNATYNCVSIPNLAAMIHYQYNVYCSWFSQGTRAMLSVLPAVLVFTVGFHTFWAYLKRSGL